MIVNSIIIEREPIKEVWLFLMTDSYGPSCSCLRVFATVDEKEIAVIAKEIAQKCECFQSVISRHIEQIIKDELAKGETDIRILPNDEDDSVEYIIVKYEIDSGIDWSGSFNCDEIEEEDRIKVFVGSKIFSTSDYNGDVEGFYSAELWEGMDSYTVE